MTATKTFRDRYELAFSTGSSTAAECYREGIERHLSGNADAEMSLKQAVEADAGFALAHAALAAVQRRGQPEEARANAKHARALSGGISRRERQHVEATALMAEGQGARALGLMREHLAEFPRDALILDQARWHLFFSGGQNRRQQEFDLLKGFEACYGDDWWFLGHFAFIHSELGEFTTAERLARRSLELYDRNFMAAHALAHLLYDTKEHRAGAAFLDAWMPGLHRRAPHYHHISWHLALFELAVGRYQRVTDLYDRAIKPAAAKNVILSNAASILWSRRLFGDAPTAEAWHELQGPADHISRNTRGEFEDVSAALVFAGAGNEAGMGRLIEGLESLAARGHPRAASVTVPLAQGVWAFSRGDYPETIRLMGPVLAELEHVGGSKAQHEVFMDTLLEAYLRASRYEEAEALLHRQLEAGVAPRDLLRLGRAQLGSGRLAEAASSLRTALRQWETADPSSPDLATIRRLATEHALAL